jgi:hypothetical protein
LDAPLTAGEKKFDSRIESAQKERDRWRALEKLLFASFDLISPPYVFTCSPPRHCKSR